MSQYFLGLDNGGTVTKAAIFDMENGDIKGISSIKTKIIFLKPHYTEKDINILWGANIKVIKEVLEKSKINGEDILGMSITGHGNGLYLSDGNGNAVYNGIISTDLRAESYLKNIDFKSLRKHTYQDLWAGQTSVLLKWFKDNEKDIMDKTKYIFLCKDFLRYKFTKEPYIEISDISGTNLLDNNTLNYNDEILQILGIEEYKDKFPKIVKPCDLCGYITDEISKITGLKKKLPVYAGLFDITACAIASGTIDDSVLSIVVGTWGINQYISKNILKTPVWMTSVFCKDNYYLNTEASPTSASNLEWFVNNLYSEEIKNTNNIFKYCDETIKKNNNVSEKLIFMPFLYGSNVVPTSGGGFLGVEAHNQKQDLLLAVYEGIIFSHKYHIDKFKSPPYKVIRLSGGASKSSIWCQMFADILGMRIEVLNGEEFGALGCAITASIGFGLYNSYDDAVRKIIKIKNVYEPNPANRDYYLNKYNNYLKIISSMENYWNSFIL